MHTENDYPIFLGSEIEQPKPNDAYFHVLPVPYEASVSYGGGTAKGPSAILNASWQLETWDGQAHASDAGIYTHQPIDCDGSGEQVTQRIASAVKGIVGQGGMPVVLGGEHTVTYGVIKGLMDAGISDIGVVQIDAHADLREAYEGNPYSHASVMKRVVDLGVPLFQLGIRAFCEEESVIRKAHGVYHIDGDIIVPQNIHQITLPNDFPEHVFFTVDVDGIDPSVFPSTGTPVPGGLSWYQTLNLFSSVAKQRKIIGFDVMEFAPIEGFHAYDFAAALLTYRLMSTLFHLKD